MTVQQTDSPSSSHYKVSLSLFSSGNCSRYSIKVSDIACVCSISAGTGREYITVRKKGNWGRGRCFRTFSILLLTPILYVGLNHITGSNSLHFCAIVSPSSLHSLSILLSYLSLCPRGGHTLSSLPSPRALQLDNPAACCPPRGEGLGAAGGGRQEQRYLGVDLRSETGDGKRSRLQRKIEPGTMQDVHTCL